MNPEEILEQKIEKLIKEYGAPENISEELKRFLIEDDHGYQIALLGLEILG